MFLRLLLVGAAVALGFEPNPPASDDLAQWAQEAQAWCNARLPEMTTVPETPAGAVSAIAAEPVPAEPVTAVAAEPQVDVATEPAPPPALTEVVTTEVATTPAVDSDAAFQQAMQGVVGVFVTDLHPTAPAAEATAVAANEVPPAITAEPAAATEVAANLPAEAPAEPVASDLPQSLLPGIEVEVNGAIESLGTLPTPASELLPVAEVPPAPTPVVVPESFDLELWTWTYSSTCDEGELVESHEEVAQAAVVEAVETPVLVLETTDATPPERTERVTQAIELTGRALKAWLQVIDAPEVALKDASQAVSR